MIERRSVAASPRAVRAAVSAALRTGDPEARTHPSELPRGNGLLDWPDELLQSSRSHRQAVDAFLPREDRRYAYDAFTRFHDRALVVAAYQGLLGRRPDSIGLHRHLDLIRDGCSKIELLGRLRYSPEGKRFGAHLPHLKLRFALAIVLEWPIVGALIGAIESVIRGPAWRRQVRRLEARLQSMIDEQVTHLAELEQVNERNLRILEERIESLRNR